MPQVEQHLANMDALLLSHAPSRLPGTQSARILAGEMLIFPVNNRRDDSRSMNGYVLGNGFYMRGFADDEIAAVMFYHYRKWGVERDKGTVWCKLDIGRSIARMHAEKPGVVQSPYAVPQAHYHSRADYRHTSSKPSAPRPPPPARPAYAVQSLHVRSYSL